MRNQLLFFLKRTRNNTRSQRVDTWNSSETIQKKLQSCAAFTRVSKSKD